MIDIVICVDGTNSHTYRNSSVKNFHRDVTADVKRYYHGPRNGATGSDWLLILEQVKADLDEISRRYGVDSFFNGYQCTVGRKPGFRFIMVGHSRGGHIIIHLAALMKYRTHFMGLYDAVERTDTMKWDDFSQVIYNVDHVYHARRDPSVGSRERKPFNMRKAVLGGFGWAVAEYAEARLMDFGNTGLRCGDGGSYQPKLFRTSHGGIGGDVLTSTPFRAPLEDDSCAITFFNQSETQVRKTALCISESAAADVWMRKNARKLGVGI